MRDSCAIAPCPNPGQVLIPHGSLVAVKQLPFRNVMDVARYDRDACRPSELFSSVPTGESSRIARAMTGDQPPYMTDLGPCGPGRVLDDYEVGGTLAQMRRAIELLWVVGVLDVARYSAVAAPPLYVAAPTFTGPSAGVVISWRVDNDEASVFEIGVETAGFVSPFAGGDVDRNFVLEAAPTAGGHIWFPWLYRAPVGMTNPIAQLGGPSTAGPNTITLNVPNAPTSFSASVKLLTVGDPRLLEYARLVGLIES